MGIRIYGASDDLIEIEGDVREEFSPGLDDEVYLAVSTGHLLRIEYTSDGQWKVSGVSAPVPGGALRFVHQAVGDDCGNRPDGTPDYSDVVEIKGKVKWVAFANKIARGAAQGERA